MDKRQLSAVRVAARFLNAFEWGSQDFKSPHAQGVFKRFWDKRGFPEIHFEYGNAIVTLNVPNWTGSDWDLEVLVDRFMDDVNDVLGDTDTRVDEYKSKIQGTTGLVQFFLREWTEDDRGF